jgi:hypothetical protein
VPTDAPGLPSPTGKDPLSRALREQRAWFNKFPSCDRATKAAAKAALTRAADGTFEVGRVVALTGHLAIGAAEFPGVARLEPDGRPSPCQMIAWQWNLHLCGGERLEIQLPGKTGGPRFGGSSCVSKVLAQHPSNVVVTGKLAKGGLVSVDNLRIEDATICRP